MALGYGSEYQLLRYLGHHRNFLDSKIKEATKSDSPIEWMDYPVDISRDSHDGEWADVQFFKHLPQFFKHLPQFDFVQISKDWDEFWPKRGQSWDGIFLQDGVVYVVEAKAHTKEMEQKCSATSDESIGKIKGAFLDVTGDQSKVNNWYNSKHYQLANRIAFVHFLNKKCGIKAKICYLFFLNGYLINPNKNVEEKKVFDKAFEDECNALDLTTEEKDYIVRVVIDAKKDGFEAK